MGQSIRILAATQQVAATNHRKLHTLLLMQQLAAQAIGARLRQARLERGLTQEELAAMASFSSRSLTNYETGVTIPYKHMNEFSRLLRKPEEWFLYGDEEEQDLGPFELLRDEFQQFCVQLAAPVHETRELVRDLLAEVRKLAQPR